MEVVVSTVFHYKQQLVLAQLTEFAQPNQFATSPARDNCSRKEKRPNEVISKRDINYNLK